MARTKQTARKRTYSDRGLASAANYRGGGNDDELSYSSEDENEQDPTRFEQVETARPLQSTTIYRPVVSPLIASSETSPIGNRSLPVPSPGESIEDVGQPRSGTVSHRQSKDQDLFSPVSELTGEPSLKEKCQNETSAIHTAMPERREIDRLKNALNTKLKEQSQVTDAYSEQQIHVKIIEANRKEHASIMEEHQNEIRNLKLEEKAAHEEWKAAKTRTRDANIKASELSQKDADLLKAAWGATAKSEAFENKLRLIDTDIRKIRKDLRNVENEVSIKLEFTDPKIQQLARKLRGLPIPKVKTEEGHNDGEGGYWTNLKQNSEGNVHDSESTSDENDDWTEVGNENATFGDLARFRRFFENTDISSSTEHTKDERNNNIENSGIHQPVCVSIIKDENAEELLLSSVSQKAPEGTIIEGDPSVIPEKPTADRISSLIRGIELRKRELDEMLAGIAGSKRGAETIDQDEAALSRDSIGESQKTSARAIKRLRTDVWESPPSSESNISDLDSDA